MAAMGEAGIGTALYYPLAVHEQEALRTFPGFVRPDLPVAESCDGRTFALPCFPGITREQQDEVVRVVKAVLVVSRRTHRSRGHTLRILHVPSNIASILSHNVRAQCELGVDAEGSRYRKWCAHQR